MTSIVNTTFAKFAVAFVAIAMMFSAVAPASAQGVDDMSLEELIALVTQLQGELGAGDDMSGDMAGSCSYTWTRSLNMGDTGADVMELQKFLNSMPETQVAATGAGSAGNETSYYGPATGAAVANFQMKYRAEILSPLGLVNPTTFFGNSTRAQANAVCAAMGDDMMDDDDGMMDDDDMDDDDNDSSMSLGNGEGDIEELDEVSSDDSDINEGELGAIFAFTAEIEGDVEVNRLDLYLDNTAAGAQSDDADDYFTEAQLWVDGEEVASVDVEDWDEDNYGNVDVVTGAGDEFRIRFSGIDLAFEDGDEPEFVLGLMAANNIDGTDLTEVWGVDMAADSIRFVDGEGFTGSTGDTTIEETFDFEEEETAELDISESSDNPDATVLEVDDENESNELEVFVFEIEEEEGVDVTINDMTLTVVVGGSETDESVIVDELMIYNGSAKLASESVPATGIVEFENIDGLEIGADETVELSVRAVVNGTEDYAEGDTIQVSFTSIDDAEDENGNDEGDMTIAGSADGETHELRSTGISVEVKSAETDVNSEDGANNDTVDFTWEIEITAFGNDDVYINRDIANIVDTAAGADDVEMIFEIERSAGAALTGVGGTVTSDADDVTGDDTAYGAAYNGEEFFVVEGGKVETFTINVSGTNQTDSKQVQAFLEAIEWTADKVEAATSEDGETAAVNTYVSELPDDSETGFATIN